jgi:hypothetical protein
VFNHEYDFVPYAFEIAPGIEIPVGEYTNVEGAIGFGTSPSRRISGSYDFYSTSFYEGRINGSVIGFSARPWSWLHFDFEEDYSDVRVPGGDLTSSISRLFISDFLNPDLSARIATQYSPLYDDFVLNFRVRWIYAAGSEIWFVYNEGRQFDLPSTSLKDRSLIFKIVHNFNF